MNPIAIIAWIRLSYKMHRLKSSTVENLRLTIQEWIGFIVKFLWLFVDENRKLIEIKPLLQLRPIWYWFVSLAMARRNDLFSSVRFGFLNLKLISHSYNTVKYIIYTVRYTINSHLCRAWNLSVAGQSPDSARQLHQDSQFQHHRYPGYGSWDEIQSQSRWILLFRILEMKDDSGWTRIYIGFKAFEIPTKSFWFL